MKSGSDLISDFWWLPKNIPIEDLLIGVGHHRPLTEEDNPCSINWLHSFDKDERTLSEAKQSYGLNFLSKWRSACKNTNVYRSLKLFDRNTGEAILLGPFLIDIDNSVLDNGYIENLDDAQTIAKQVVMHLVEKLNVCLDDLRIFFSGRKGFNVEIRPETLGIKGPVPDQIKLSSRKLDNIIAVLRNKNNVHVGRRIVSSQETVIDLIYGDKFLKHPYVRLHNSVNKWVRSDGNEVTRRKIEITIKQLWNMSAAEIAQESEKLAQIP